LLHWMQFFEQSAFTFDFPENDDDITVDHVGMLVRFFLTEETAVIPRSVFEKDLPVFSDMEERAITLKKGQKIDFTALFQDLIDRGYGHGEDRHLEPGDYRRVGDTL